MADRKRPLREELPIEAVKAKKPPRHAPPGGFGALIRARIQNSKRSWDRLIGGLLAHARPGAVLIAEVAGAIAVRVAVAGV
jgi:hypothetical protein